jgi:type II secretory pathway component PulF
VDGLLKPTKKYPLILFSLFLKDAWGILIIAIVPAVGAVIWFLRGLYEIPNDRKRKYLKRKVLGKAVVLDFRLHSMFSGVRILLGAGDGKKVFPPT